MIKKTFNSTFDLIYYYCSLGKVQVRLYQKFSTVLYPEFLFGNEELQKDIHVPFYLWFIDGEGEIPWSDFIIEFYIDEGSLHYTFEDCRLDEEYYSDYDEEEHEYLLDVQELKDDVIYSIYIA